MEGDANGGERNNRRRYPAGKIDFPVIECCRRSRVASFLRPLRRRPVLPVAKVFMKSLGLSFQTQRATNALEGDLARFSLPPDPLSRFLLFEKDALLNILAS